MGRVWSAFEFIVQLSFWAIGYFIGFSLVTLLSGGWLVADDFYRILAPRATPWKPFMVLQSRRVIAAEIVSMIGWIALLATCALLAYLLWKEDPLWCSVREVLC